MDRKPCFSTNRRRRPSFKPCLEILEERTVFNSGWSGTGANAQHTGLAPTAAQPLQAIHWQTPVDQSPQFSSNELLIHYGSPLVTPGNTVIVPVKTGPFNGFQIEAFDGSTGTPKWTVGSDYLLPTDTSWVPEYAPVLAGGRLYFAGAGGTLFYINNLDSTGPHSPVRVAFYGMDNFNQFSTQMSSSLYIDTPLTADSKGDVFFGFRALSSNPLNIQSGIARIDPTGKGTFTTATAASGGDFNIGEVPHNCAPALSNDQTTLYIGVRAPFTEYYGYLVALDSTTLKIKTNSSGGPERMFVNDPRPLLINPGPGGLLDISTASPTVAPDGDVFYGMMGNPFNGSRGWLMHTNADLSQLKTPGAFGWDDTVSIVPASMVPSYHGTSKYLIFTKYNNYAGFDSFSDWGNDVNEIAILDPNATEVEPHPSSSGLLTMKVVMAMAGPTPDPTFLSSQFPNAVREWCINSAAVDPATKSILVNSEDGKLYRWDLTTDTLSQVVTLTSGLGEAYTPTVVGSDGTVYAINDATLFAVGRGPAAPPAVTLSAGSLIFGSEAVGTTSPAPEATNVIETVPNVNFVGFTQSGPDAADFTLLNPPAVGALSTGPLQFSFTPSHLGAESADFKFQTNQAVFTVHLTGNGTTPLQLSANPLDFGAEAVGSTTFLKSLTLSNLAAGVQLLGITATGPNVADFLPLDLPSPGLLPQGNQVLHFEFDPTQLGTESASYTLKTNDGSVTINLRGTGVTAHTNAPLQLSQSAVLFGNQTVGVSSSPLGVTLTNLGTGGKISLESITASGPNAADFPLLAAPPLGVLPLGGRTLLFGFIPTHTGSESAVYTLNTTAGKFTIQLSGSGTSPLRLSATGIDFGSTAQTATATQTLTLTNLDSKGDVRLLSITSTSKDAADFPLLSAPPLGTLAGGTSSLVFGFTPSRLGSEAATFLITTNAGSFTVNLQGNGIFPLSLSTNRIDFGSYPVSTPALQQTVTFTNLGGNVVFQSLTISGPDQADFSLANTFQLPSPGQLLSVGQIVPLTFNFDPSHAGIESATVTIVTSEGTLTLELTGVGLVFLPGGLARARKPGSIV
jgi:hypothetical protein